MHLYCHFPLCQFHFISFNFDNLPLCQCSLYQVVDVKVKVILMLDRLYAMPTIYRSIDFSLYQYSKFQALVYSYIFSPLPRWLWSCSKLECYRISKNWLFFEKLVDVGMWLAKWWLSWTVKEVYLKEVHALTKWTWQSTNVNWPVETYPDYVPVYLSVCRRNKTM